MDDKWQRARIIPVVGTGAGNEREQRATSALLAVLSIVRTLSIDLLSPLGASRAGAARVDTYVEPPFKLADKTTSRPDGLIEVRYGNQSPWTALVEVKTGNSVLTAEQVNRYIEIARGEGYQAVITISNEIAPSEGQHPTAGLKVRKGSKVAVHHFSWTRIANVASRIKARTRESDPEQAWLVDELLRYLEHASSGAVELDDMGPDWVNARELVRTGSLTRTDPNATDIAQRWDKFLTYAALKLGMRVNADVQEKLPRAEQEDVNVRTKRFVTQLCESGVLTGELIVPQSIGELNVSVDLRARLTSISTTFRAPEDKKARGSISWLVRQLADAPGSIEIGAFARNSRSPVVATLAALRDDANVMAAELPGDVAKFTVTMRSELGMGRRSARTSGFIESVLDAVYSFYEQVHQELVAYQPRAPQAQAKSGNAESLELGSVTD
ncbi:hypothetical protein [Demequina aurantiaca]|uniref:hypothetical protein n=1 Tax=Demequina aurantiaca TaxID=676200 RepID=UPI003D347941